MAKIEKVLEKWKNSIPPTTPIEDVEKVARSYGFVIEVKKGSHTIYSHEKLIGESGYSEFGGFTVASVKGRHVKRVYIQDLLKAIEIIENEEGNDEKE